MPMQSISSLLKRGVTPAPPVLENPGEDTRERPPIQVAQGRNPATGPRFAPTARLLINPSLRTSGLLMGLSDEAAKTLLAVLTFLTPDGRLQATVTQIAVGLGESDKTTRDRVVRLCAISWEGKPIAFLLPRESGLDAVVISPHLITYEEEEVNSSVSEPAIPVAGRAAVMERSRAMYARPRAEVERMVMEQLGYPTSEADNTPEYQVRRSLSAFGVSLTEVEDLMRRFPLEQIARQIEWMGYRKAKSPGRYLVAAIENAYAPPIEVRKKVKEGNIGDEGSLAEEQGVKDADAAS